MEKIDKNLQYYKFSLYGFFKNLRFFEHFLLLFFLEKGIDYIKIGMLYSVREVMIILLEIPSGLVADTLGRRKTLVSAFVLYISSFVVFYFSNHIGLMIFGMIMFAFGDAFRSGVNKAMIFHYLKKNGHSGQKINYYGHTRSWSQNGSAISSLIAGAAVFYYGSYRIIFVASIIPYLLDIVLILSYPAYLDSEIKPLENFSPNQKLKVVLSAFVKSFKDIQLLRTLTSLSLYTGYYKAVKDYLQPVIMAFALSVPFFTTLKDKQKTAFFVGVFYFFIYLLTASMSRNSGKFSDHFVHACRPMNITIIFSFAIGITIGIFYNLHLFFFSIIGFLLIMMVENLRKPIGIALVSELSKNQAMASVLSVQSQANSLFAALFAPVIGFFADLYGPGTSIFLVSIFLVLMAPLYWLRSKSKNTST